MCGIVICLVPGRHPAGAALHMNHALRHRGPDGEGYLLVDGNRMLNLAGPDTPFAVLEDAASPHDGDLRDFAQMPAQLVLGQRRLSIVDLSAGGHQPMRREGTRGESLWAVFNGEVYNHVELRVELEALGHRFRSHSDTEVLLAAYAQWGEAALGRFNGMWACAIYDAGRRELFIARDRFGVKPLYLWEGPDGALLMASEIKALLQHPLVRSAPDEEACVRFLQTGPQAGGAETLFRGIRRFPAGHWARRSLEGTGALRPQPYWQWPAEPDPSRPFEATEADRLSQRYLELLDDAVGLRLRADVAVGTALSGGLDSSSVAALVNRRLRKAGADDLQQVFSSIYRDPAYAAADESAYIAVAAAQLGVRSHTIEARWQDLPKEHERMIWALDEPPANTLMSSWHTYRLVAAEGVTVTLDGQGADEQLAGYARYVQNHLVHAGWGEAVREAQMFNRTMPGFGRQLIGGLGLKAIRSVAGVHPTQSLVRSLRMGSQPLRRVDEALRADFGTGLANLIFYADKTSMAWSVESRMPFMDYRLVEFLATVPPAYKLHEGWTKWLARNATAATLPDSIVWRRDKLGWPIPEEQWFGGPLAGWLQRQLSEGQFAAGIAARARPRPGLAARLRQLNLAVWHRLYFEEAGRPGRVLGRSILSEIPS